MIDSSASSHAQSTKLQQLEPTSSLMRSHDTLVELLEIHCVVEDLDDAPTQDGSVSRVQLLFDTESATLLILLCDVFKEPGVFELLVRLCDMHLIRCETVPLPQGAFKLKGKPLSLNFATAFTPYVTWIPFFFDKW